LSLFTFVFLTGSRSSLVSTIAAFLSQIVRNPRLLIAMIIATVMIVIASLALESNVAQIFEANEGVARRYTEEEIERGGHGRLEIARAAFTVGVENLFLGIGIDQFRQKHFTRFFQVITRSGELKRMGVHNTYITILTEWGALAFIACGLAMFRTYRVASLVPEFKLWIHGFLWSGLVIGLASHVVGTPHFWLILGFCLQSLRLADRRPGSPVGQRVDFRTPSPGRVTG
ncbi:MAG: O-antigen ligase family protein, partial [Planctomycetaceae bacterium]|nr:O-antigen ligase family protein [Planctomycetaceae bacterium]